MKLQRIMAVVGAAALTLLFAGTALGVAYATVDDHVPASSEANHADYWESEGVTCTKIYDGEGAEIDHWATDKDYALVVVKAGAQNVGDNANTVFKNTAKGEVVWADTNGDNAYNAGGEGGDKAISHIIVCELTETETTTTTTTTTDKTTDTTTTTTTTTDETTDTETTDTETTDTTTTVTTTTTSTETETTTPSGSVEELTPPRTDTLAPAAASVVSTGLLLVLAGILSAIVIVVPALARNRR